MALGLSLAVTPLPPDEEELGLKVKHGDGAGPALTAFSACCRPADSSSGLNTGAATAVVRVALRLPPRPRIAAGMGDSLIHSGGGVGKLALPPVPLHDGVPYEWEGCCGPLGDGLVKSGGGERWARSPPPSTSENRPSLPLLLELLASDF